MIRCQKCQSANLDTSRFCDECGTRLVAAESPPAAPPPAYAPPQPTPKPASVTSLGVPDVPVGPARHNPFTAEKPEASGIAHASLTIERGDQPGTEFRLVNDESTIGRW